MFDMGKYKIGDIAASLPKPKTATTDSGKKLQALFSEFYNKNKTGIAEDNPEIKHKSSNTLSTNSESTIKKSKSHKGKKRKLSTEHTIDESSSVTENARDCKKGSKKHALSSVIESEHLPKKKKFKRNEESVNVDDNSSFIDEFVNKGSALIKHKKKHKKALNPESENFNKNKRKEAKVNDISNASNMLTSESIGKNSNVNNNKKNLLKEDKSSFEPKSFPRKKKFTNSQGSGSNFNNFKSFNKRHQRGNKFDKDLSIASENSNSDFQFQPYKDDHDSKKKLKDVDSFDGDNVETNSKKKKNKKWTKERNEFLSNKEENQQERKFSEKSKKRNLKEAFSVKSYEPDSKIKSENNSASEDFVPLKATKYVDSEEKNERTVFVGNLHKTIQKKALKKMFSSFGQIESIRFRGAVPKKETISKKLAGQIGQYHEGIFSIIAYIVFKEKKDAQKALVMNGSFVDGRHIVVNAATNTIPKLYDNKQSIFIGNLPYNVDDEAVWAIFEKCGKIEGIRLVRDRNTGVGKGFGYVSFASDLAKLNALSLDNVEVGGRTIRIKTVESRPQDTRLNDKKMQFHSFKQSALKMKKNPENPSSRKSTKKIMKRQKNILKKKKIAKMFKSV